MKTFYRKEKGTKINEPYLDNAPYWKMLSDLDDYAILLLDIEGNIIHWNKGAEKMNGYTTEEILGKNFRMLYSQEEQEQKIPEQLLAETVKAGRVQREGWQTKRDGTVYWDMIVITTLRDEKGEVKGFGKIIHDQTVRKQAEEDEKRAIKEKEVAQLNKIQRIAHLGSWEVDMETYNITWSDELYRIFGLEPRSIKPDIEAFFSFLHPDDARRLRKEFANIQNNRKDISTRLRAIRADGTVGHLYSEAKFECDQDGKPILLYGIIHDETEQVEAEESLRKSEKFLRTIIANSADGIVLYNMEMEAFFVSDNCKRILGYEPVELMGPFENNRIHPEDIDKVKHCFSQTAIEPSKTSSIEYRFRRHDGNYIWLEGDYSSYLNDTGQQTIIVNYRDISKRKNAQQVHLQSEENLRLIMDFLPHLIFAKDRDDRFIFANKLFCEMYGVAPEQLIGRHVSEVIPEKGEVKKLLDEDAVVIRTGMQKVIPNIHLTDIHGNKRIFHTTKVPFTPSGGKEKAILTVAVEITEIKRTQEALMESTYLLEKAQEIGHVGHWVLTLEDSEKLYWSDETLRIFGVDKKNFDGNINTFFAMVYPDDLEKVKQSGKLALQSGDRYNIIHRIIRGDGELRWVHQQADILRADNDKVESVVGVCQDITEQKLADENIIVAAAALKELNSELEERVVTRTTELTDANLELEAFSFTVSHDLRTPIRAIQIFGSLLQNKYKDGDDQDHTYLGNIMKCTVEMTDMINDLLTFSRMGKQELIRSKVNMDEMVKEVTKSILYTKRDKVVKWTIDELPCIAADATLIRSVWVNLLSNAVKYSRKEVTCKIHVSYKEENGMVVFTVKDNGIGFDMQYYDMLFKPFSRLHTSPEYKGTGAGLAICDRIVKKHGGAIWAESLPGIGSTFSFSLPIGKGSKT